MLLTRDDVREIRSIRNTDPPIIAEKLRVIRRIFLGDINNRRSTFLICRPFSGVLVGDRCLNLDRRTKNGVGPIATIYRRTKMAARMIHVKLCGRDGGGVVVGVWKEQGLLPGKPRVCGQIIYGDAKLKSFAPFEKQRRSRAPTTPIYVLGCGRPVDRLSLHPARESFELRPATRSIASHRRPATSTKIPSPFSRSDRTYPSRLDRSKRSVTFREIISAIVPVGVKILLGARTSSCSLVGIIKIR